MTEQVRRVYKSGIVKTSDFQAISVFSPFFQTFSVNYLGKHSFDRTLIEHAKIQCDS